MSQAIVNTTAGRWRRTASGLAVAGLIAWLLADIAITRTDPGSELARIGSGFLSPDWFATEQLGQALANTLAFALQGTALGLLCGSLLALLWHWRWVRSVAASIRAVHELFWGLLLLQVTGLSPLTGVLAIAIPYAGIFAKVFGEYLEEADRAPARALPSGSAPLSRFFFARLPLIWAHCRTYAAYRLECAIRAAAILGFIGLPTLGFHMETAFREGNYSEGAAQLYLLFALILTLRWWLKPLLLPIYLLAALYWAPPLLTANSASLIHFISVDMMPSPLVQGHGLAGLWPWFSELWQQQLWPGLWRTLVLGCAALLLTGVLTLLLLPLVSPLFGNRLSRAGGQGLLVALRSTPEFFLAFVLLILLGPSMLPGIIALALHTSAILAHLSGQLSATLTLRQDSPRGLDRYCWEVLPRLTPNLLSLLLYRWEIIMRETAVLGILGIHTLGFYIDSSMAEFRFDRTLLLIIASVLLNLAVDALSRTLRARIKNRDNGAHCHNERFHAALPG